jgi:uncharacterized protein YfdQ (DUF2303 family)
MTTDTNDALTNTAKNGSALASMATALRSLHGAEIKTVGQDGPGNAVIAILPKDKRIEDLQPILDKYLVRPSRRTGTATLTDLTSLLSHIARFATAETAVFADPARQAPKLTVVFDYHPSEKKAPKSARTDWMVHRAVYAPTLSDPWKVWTQFDNKHMSQGDFATFIEDRLVDLVVPNLDDPTLKTFAELVQGKFAEPSDLVALSRGLQISVDVKVRNAVQLNTGAIQVQYEEVHEDGQGQPISIPNLFQICVPVFYGGANYRMAVRLRYRLAGQKLSWHYTLVRPELVFDDAFLGIVEQVRKDAQLTVFLGTPEK